MEPFSRERTDMKLGFIGTGEITAAMVAGLSSSGLPLAIQLSPRNARIAADLAARFPIVTIASSNQEVLDSSEAVIIAVRPSIARGVLSELSFRADHHVISIVSGLPLQSVSELIKPATQVTRAVPLPSSAKRMSPTAIFPPDRSAEELFAAMGAVFPTATEREFDAICTATATIACFYTFIAEISTWLTRNGIPETTASNYIAQMFSGVLSAAVDGPIRNFKSLASSHATPGGINEQFLGHMLKLGLPQAVSQGLDAVKQRVTIGSTKQ
jgi:pyrroline-5-carboxylate reductase